MGKRGPQSRAELEVIASNRAVIAANRSIIDRDLAQPPKHLSEDMKVWWADVISNHEQLEPHQVHVLRAACEAWDRCQQAREALKQHGLTYVDDKGLIRQRPEVAIERDSRTAFLRALRELKLDVIPPTGGSSAYGDGDLPWLRR